VESCTPSTAIQKNASGGSLRRKKNMDPRYTIEVLSAPSGHGYMVKVKDNEQENGGYAWEALRPRPTEADAASLGQAWIDATVKRDTELDRLRHERARELPGQLAEIRANMKALADQKSDLATQIKQLEADAWNLVKDANNPVVHLDFAEPFPEQQELVDDPDDDPPVADANGRHPDGPKPKGAKRGKRRGKKKAPPRVRHDDNAPLPSWSPDDTVEVLTEAAEARGLIRGNDDRPKKSELVGRLRVHDQRPGLDPDAVDWFGEGEEAQA
jgi:hypothetical protein